LDPRDGQDDHSPMNWDIVRQNLRQAIERLEISHNDLARSSGVDQPTISRFLSGKHETLTLDNLSALAKPLKVTVGQLIGELPLYDDNNFSRLLIAAESMPAYKVKALAAAAEALAKE
jgi:transcriptional regulator with XRE-family HTH domain